MTEQEIEKLVQDKLNEAYKENEPPKKFFLTENGRGVVDGGDMYNAVVEDVLRIVQKAMTETLKAALTAPRSVRPMAPKPDVPHKRLPALSSVPSLLLLHRRSSAAGPNSSGSTSGDAPTHCSPNG